MFDTSTQCCEKIQSSEENGNKECFVEEDYTSCVEGPAGGMINVKVHDCGTSPRVKRRLGMFHGFVYCDYGYSVHLYVSGYTSITL